MQRSDLPSSGGDDAWFRLVSFGERSLEKLQAEHGDSMARCAILEDKLAVMEAALAAQKAGE